MPIKRIWVAYFLTLALSITLLVALPKQELFLIDVAEMDDSYMTIEGYVVSKRVNSIWLADEPKSLWEKLTGYFTSYGTGSVRVIKHTKIENADIFRGLKTNQHVRVYGDSFRESNPPVIYAYYIEVIN